MPTSPRIILWIAACLAILEAVQSVPSRLRRDDDDDDKYSSKELKTEDLKKKDEPEILFEGDIVLSHEQKLANGIDESEVSSIHKRSALSSSTSVDGKEILQLWPNGTVPYEYASRLGAKERKYFMTAMKIIENGTCIRFISKLDTHADFIVLDHVRDGCKSNVGRSGGAQQVALSDQCSSAGHALHELGHAVGLWHEHSRPDRDVYIEFIKENLKYETDEIHFKKTSQALFKTVPDVGYDIQSMMHYNEFAYASSSNGIDMPTLRIKEDSGLEELQCENRLQMGQRQQLSYKDRLRIKQLYGCSGVVEEPECIRPTPTPTISTATEDEEEVSSTPIPNPSVTVAPPPPVLKRLKTGNILTLNLIETKHINGKEETVNDERGIECTPSPGCVPIECLGSACSSINNQFQIVKRDESDTRNVIRGKNTVLLRSIKDYGMWLDCSDPSFCTISECGEDNEDDPRNASYVSSCMKHRFQIIGVKRGTKVLNVNSTLMFKSIEHNSFLKCDHRVCRADQPVCRPNSATSASTSCFTDIFKATKESEY